MASKTMYKKLSVKVPIKTVSKSTVKSYTRSVSKLSVAKTRRDVEEKEKSPKKKRKIKHQSIISSNKTRLSKVRLKSDDDTYGRQSLKYYVIEHLENLDREFFIQRVYVFAQNQEISSNTEVDISNQMPEQNYLQYFRDKFNKIVNKCDSANISNDPVSGFLISMGTHSIFIIEGPEQSLSNYFYELALIENQLWQKSKIFLVENDVDMPYFEKFMFCTSDAININTKYPSNTTTEANLMAPQHVVLKAKLKSVIEQLVEDRKFRNDEEMDFVQALPPDPYNKLLPPIQCIDLCLNADKFYLSLKRFAHMYFTIIYSTDHDDILFWPIEYNYVPFNIFERSAYDVNLTFSDYGEIILANGDERGDRLSSVTVDRSEASSVTHFDIASVKGEVDP